jgi:uncharacterized protein YhhL (DUF1145 family)
MKNVLYKLIIYCTVFLRIFFVCSCVIIYGINNTQLGILVYIIFYILVLLSFVYPHNRGLKWTVNLLSVSNFMLFVFNSEVFPLTVQISDLVDSKPIPDEGHLQQVANQGVLLPFLKYKIVQNFYKQRIFNKFLNSLLYSQSNEIKIRVFEDDYIISTTVIFSMERRKFDIFLRTFRHTHSIEIMQKVKDLSFKEIPRYAIFIYEKIIKEYKYNARRRNI